MFFNWVTISFAWTLKISPDIIELYICLWGYVSNIKQIFLWSSLTASFFNADGFVLPNPQGPEEFRVNK